MSTRPELGDLEKHILIDKNDLDDELVHQPEIYFHACEGYALAVSERDAAKLDQEKMAAQVSVDCREKLEADGKRATEALVSSCVLLDDRMIAAKQAYLAAKLEADLWSAQKDAYSQRGYMLRDLCGLYVANYYSESAVEGQHSNKVMDQANIKNRQQIRDKKLANA